MSKAGCHPFNRSSGRRKCRCGHVGRLNKTRLEGGGVRYECDKCRSSRIARLNLNAS